MMQPAYALAASVGSGNRIKQFHSEEAGSVRYILMEPPVFRHAGFDLKTLDVPHPGPNDSIEVRNGERKVLRLYQDGTLIFRAAADESFLGWGQDHGQFLAFPRLNPVAVVEMHASFVHLYARLLPHLHKPPAEVLFGLTLKNGVWDGTRLFLTEYYKVPIWQVVDPMRYLIHSEAVTEELTASAKEVAENPNAVAFRLVALFASMFDMPEDKIPFVKEVNGTKAVDIQQIVQLRG